MFNALAKKATGFSESISSYKYKIDRKVAVHHVVDCEKPECTKL